MRGNKGRSYNTPRGSRDKYGAERVSSILGSSFASLGISAKIKEYNIKKAWAGAVGPNISKRASPVRLVGTVLYCAVSSSPWMTELSYQKPAIITRLNKGLNEAAVTDMVFRIGKVSEAEKPDMSGAVPERDITPEERAFIERTVAPVKDDKLKTLIKRAMEKAKR